MIDKAENPNSACVAHPRRWPALLLGAALMLGASGCASYPRFSHSEADASRYVWDDANCRAQAEQLDEAYDQAAERYDSGSDEEMIGGVLGASLAEKAAKRKAYVKCMKMAGYKKI